jgi:hypothetical protein
VASSSYTGQDGGLSIGSASHRRLVMWTRHGRLVESPLGNRRGETAACSRDLATRASDALQSGFEKERRGR